MPADRRKAAAGRADAAVRDVGRAAQAARRADQPGLGGQRGDAVRRRQVPPSEYLDLLGVEAEALQSLDEAELKKLYKRRALELHPDKSDHPDAAGRFRRLQEAYEALKEPSTRSFFARFARWRRRLARRQDLRRRADPRGWQRTRQGMRMASERVTLKDDFARARDGHVLPLEERYAKALGEHGGVWVIVCDQEDRKACASLSKVVGPSRSASRATTGSASPPSTPRWSRTGAGSARSGAAGDGGTAVFVLPPLPWAAEGRAWDRYDAEPVDCEPHNNLPMRLASREMAPDSRVLLDTDGKAACAAERGGFPRLGVEHRGEPAFWLELADDGRSTTRGATRLRHALAGIYAARRASLTPRASRALAVDGLGDIKDPLGGRVPVDNGA
ncbi:hypothetical protein JL721_8990 [Aureococcus anophagefferens]|nr:hypothetical protein JL721_8990 [Aureococcus anophagefferens]